MSWSDIRLRSNQYLSDVINDLIVKANLAAASTNQITTADKISPIRLIKSKMEVNDTGMMTGYARVVGADTSYKFGNEPDGINLRLMTKFDGSGGPQYDYSYMSNDIQSVFKDTLPQVIKAAMDDGVTAGEICTVLDGKSQYFRIANNNNISIKKMVADGKTGFTVLYRVYPLLITNEANNGSGKRATLDYYVENDQIDYAFKIEIGDNGVLHFYVKYLTNYYYSFSTSTQIVSTVPPDYFSPDFSPNDFQTYLTALTQLPIPFIDIAFEFNFSTKAISMFVNGVSIAVTTGATPPTSTFPASFADPPPPNPVPAPYYAPFVTVYSQTPTTTTKKINAVTTSTQNAPYAVDNGEATNDPLTVLYTIAPGVSKPASPLTVIDTTNISGASYSYIPLCKDTSNTNNCKIASLQFMTTPGTGLMGDLVANKIITGVLFNLTGSNGIVGNYYIRIWDNNGNVAHTMYSGDAAEYDNVQLSTEFIDNSQDKQVSTGWRIGVEYNNGNLADILKVQRLNNSDDSVAQSVVKPNASTYTVNTTYDVMLNLYEGQDTSGSDPWYGLANTTGAVAGVGEFIQSGSSLEGQTPTTIELYAYRSTTATAGTISIYHRAGDGTTKALLLTINVTDLPTTQPTAPNLTWQNVNYGNSIVSGDSITVEASGVNAGNVNIMNNSNNNAVANSYNGANSFLITRNQGATTWAGVSDLDLAGRIWIGGNSFSGYIALDDQRKRTGIKVNNSQSLLAGIIPTKITVTFNKFNNPAVDNIYCNIRDSTGTVKVAMGQISMNAIFVSDTSVDFVNRQNKYALAVGDTISLEYALGTATDYLIIRVNTGQIDGENTSLFETIGTGNVTNALQNRDLSGIVFTGGVIDLTARTMRGVKINAGSVLIGKAITCAKITMFATGTFSADAQIKCWIIRGTDKAKVAALGVIQASSIQNTATLVTFTFTANAYTMKAGDMIGVEFNAGDANNYISIICSTVDVFDGSATSMFEYDGFVYTDNPANDIYADLLTGGNYIVPDPTPQPPATPFHWYHGHIIGAAIPPDSNATQDPINLDPPSYSYFNLVLKEFRLYSLLLSATQLNNYYSNKFTISSIAFQHVKVMGHDIINLNNAA